MVFVRKKILFKFDKKWGQMDHLEYCVYLTGFTVIWFNLAEIVLEFPDLITPWFQVEDSKHLLLMNYLKYFDLLCSKLNI